MYIYKYVHKYIYVCMHLHVYLLFQHVHTVLRYHTYKNYCTKRVRNACIINHKYLGMVPVGTSFEIHEYI